MRFCPNAPEWLLTSCLNSTVELKNLFNPLKTKILYDTRDWNKWFVSCDLNSFLYAAGIEPDWLSFNVFFHEFPYVTLICIKFWFNDVFAKRKIKAR